MRGQTYVILYVREQGRATEFYAAVLAAAPRLNVPGMTEFDLPGGAVLGLMPVEGIRRLLGETLPDPAAAAGIPRAELYLLVDEPGDWHNRALAGGARELSPIISRDWGHDAGYVLDQDGHVIAFARVSGPPAAFAAPDGAEIH